VTGPDGRVLAANTAFLTMAQIGSAARAVGKSLDSWLGETGVDVDILLANLRQRGAVRLFASKLRGEQGLVTDVEISANAVKFDGSQNFGFNMRDVSRRFNPRSERSPGIPRSMEQLTDLIGRVSMKDLVRDATDVIERLCIDAALELTKNNRASAAEMLGLSRQSLYIKLRRYGLGEPGDADGDGDDGS
jgi:transcriptional regulator PpsR